MSKLGTVLLVALAAIGLVACGGGSAQKADMALACQTMECTCVETGKGLLSKTMQAPVQWRTNGDAFCATGFELRRAGKN